MIYFIIGGPIFYLLNFFFFNIPSIPNPHASIITYKVMSASPVFGVVAGFVSGFASGVVVGVVTAGFSFFGVSGFTAVLSTLSYTRM